MKNYEEINKLVSAVLESVAQTIEDQGPLTADDIRDAIPIIAMQFANAALNKEALDNPDD